MSQVRCARWFVGLLCGVTLSAAQADHRAATEAVKARNWSLVFKECKADADAGERNCQRHMATLYKEGLGVERNLPLSVDYLKKCVGQGDIGCEEMLGDSYRRGLGVAVNYEEALRLFRSSASRGNPWAHNNLGNLYRFGQGVARDPIEAAKHYRAGADRGNGQAQANLADLFRLGEGVEKNGDAAFQLAQKSSQQNFGAGWNLLGLLYRDGVGVRQDPAAAISAFRKAADPGAVYPVHSAFAHLARMHYEGTGIPVDLDEAARWAEMGVRVNERDCMVYLALILARGGKTVAADKTRAFELAKRAFDRGSVSAGNVLGAFYRDGVGTPVDAEAAAKYFRDAVEKGDLNAMVNLGRLHQKGEGVTNDPRKADEYFTLARARQERLSPGNRRFVDSYFAARPAEVAGPATGPGNTPAPATVGNNAPRAQAQPQVQPQSLSADQRALLDRLEKMQKQLEALQASANTINQNQVQERTASAAVRRALVIGNDHYQHVSPLVNAREDATAISGALTRLGYSVSLHKDVDEKKFKQILRDFRAALEGGEEVLFFFAGHGVQLGSANYLLPVDIKGDNEEQVKDEAIELQKVLDDLKSRNSKFALAIIDACRDNPFKKSGRALGGRGLAPTTAATGQMIMFSAGSGQQALDKLSNTDPEKNGVFTRVLLKEMLKPGVPVDRVLRNVRNEVVRLSKSVGHEQTPALYDQAVGDFYFSLK